jgi:hypothetical protein
MHAYGYITKALEKIQTASTPDRFTQDFLATKLGMKGGSPKPVIPFLKRIGFLGTDGAPTELYKQFRNNSQRGIAAAEALRAGYGPLYEINEYVHDAKDDELPGIVVQATGLDAKSRTVKSILGSFKAVRTFADFDATSGTASIELDAGREQELAIETLGSTGTPNGLNLSYTINLNLPSTSDIAVFNAIFRSLREHLLND